MTTKTLHPSASTLGHFNVYASASDLKEQLHSIEERSRENERVGEELRQKLRALQERCRVLEETEDREKALTKALQRELEAAREAAGGVWKFEFRFGAWKADEENGAMDVDDGRPQAASGKALAKKNVFQDCWKQITQHLVPNAREYTRLSDSEGTAGISKTSGSRTGHHGRFRRLLAEKMKQKTKLGWENRPRRRVSKSHRQPLAKRT